MSETDAIHQEELAGGIASPVELEYQSATTAAAHGAERNRRVLWSVITGVLTKPLAILISFFSVPLFLKYLGAERYGLYEAIIALSTWLALSNAGLAYGLVNKLTDCHVSGDRELARRYVSSLFFLLLAMTVAFVVLASAVAPLIHWQSVFPADDPRARAEVPWVVWATAVVTFCSLTASLPAAAYAGYQQIDRNNYWDGVSKLATLGGCFAVVHTRFGLLGVAMVMLAIPTVVRLVNTASLLTIEKPWLRPSWTLFDWRLLRGTVGEGIYIFVLQTAAILIFHSDKVVIAKMLGGKDVADFAILGRLFLIAYGAFSLLLTPLWPAYGEAARRGDLRWVHRTLRLSLVLGCGTVMLCGVAMFFFGNTILRIWAGPGVSVSRGLVVATTALFMTRAAAECQSVVLNSIGVMVPQMFVLGANALLNLATAIIFAKRFGVVGVAWSFPLTALVTSLWAYPWLIHRYLSSRLGPTAQQPAEATAPGSPQQPATAEGA